IHGVLLASAVNHGGRASSLTAPNPQAQAALLAQVWEAAGVSSATIRYLEAHGTGTELGDPIEIEGIQAAFAERARREQITLPEQNCGLGSVKSNIGHLEPASGIAGLIKVLLALRHRTLPATLHCQDVNPYIKLAGSPLYLVTNPQPWPVEPRQPRRAGVSSFGFGGVNAHLLVEEAPERASATADSQPRPFPLSARDRMALQRRATQLRDWLKEQSTPVETGLIADLAFTLQTGREAFEQRLVIVAATAEELLAGLEHVLAGASTASNIYQGGRDEPLPWRELLTPAPAVPRSDETATTLARRWVTGETVTWENPDPTPRRRLHLPGYPFVGPRYWPNFSSSRSVTEKGRVKATDSSSLVGEECKVRAFHSILTPSDWRVRDHRVGTEGVLPAMACVAMAWSAARQQVPSIPTPGLRDLTWLQPLKVDGATRELTLNLTRNGQDGAMRFALQSQANGETPQLHAQGEINWSEPSPRLPAFNLTEIRQRCPRQQPSASLYQKLAERDLHYGPSFRLLETVWSNDDEALGRLRPPLPDTDEDELHPALLDAALQTAAALTGNVETGTPLPFSLTEARIIAPLKNACYAYVRRRGHNGALPPLDISLCDEQGQALVELRDFHARLAPLPAYPLSLTSEGTECLPLSFLTPGWRTVATQPRSGGRTLLFRQPGDAPLGEAFSQALGGEVMQVWLADGWQRLGRQTWRMDAANPEHYRQLLETTQPDCIWFPGGWYEPELLSGQEALAVANHTLLILFRLLQAIAQQTQPPTLRVITHDLYPLTGTDPVAPWAGLLSGLCRSFALEYPDADLHCLDLDSRDLWPALIVDPATWLREPAEATDMQWLWRNGECRTQTLNIVDLSPADLTFRQGGVYLITGGAGGLGAAFARRLAGDYQARLLLTGRRPADEPAIFALLQELNAIGGECAYQPVDACDRDGMAALLNDLRQRWGQLHGVLHCPLELRNVALAKMTEADLQAPLAAKVAAVTVLRELLCDASLDFVALFSSAIALTGGAGQANYAAASTGMDAIARAWRVQARYPVKTLNWGYWGETGIVATPEHRARVARQGVAPITTTEGIAAFAAMLAAPQPEIMAIKMLPGHAPRPEQVDHTIPCSDSLPASEPVLVPENALEPATRDYLRRCFAEVLHTEAADIGDHRSYETLGVDSLVMMQLIRRLEQDLGKLPKTLLFEARTVAMLADRLIAEQGPRLGELLLRTPVDAESPEPPQPDAQPSRLPLHDQPGYRAEPIAIIGLAGRYPGADHLTAFWENLQAGQESIREVPPERWKGRDWFDATGERRDCSYSQWGGFLNGVDQFDPLFFGISPREARGMDPQERLFLEIAWAALEDAAYTRWGLAAAARVGYNRDVGVFVGVMHGNYPLVEASQWQPGQPLIANSPYWSIANRVSHFGDFHGPSLAVDTACSSSLTAIHLACESLRRGECGAALAGGVNLLLHPRQAVILSQMKMLARGPHCRPFGAGADGLVMGEGVGAVLLRPLRDALRDADPIHGVIAASSINAGGHAGGYTVPNPDAQAALLQETLERAGWHPDTIGYAEAHGTGTALGDPIEVAALTRVWRQHSTARHACALGSVKSNIGHLEAAAGIAGLTKTLLQLRHATLVPTLHCAPANPHIEWADSPFCLVQARQPWTTPAGVELRRASISSFGAGGANAHLLVEEHRAAATAPATDQPSLIVLSARSEGQLREQARQLLKHLERSPQTALSNLAYTLQVGRESFNERLALPVMGQAELRQQLSRFAAGDQGIWLRGSEVPEAPETAIAPAELAEWRQWALTGEWSALGQRWIEGRTIPWAELATNAHQRIHLPTYPFARQSYWLATAQSLSSSPLSQEGKAPSLLDSCLPALHEARFVKR
ncbi:MAG TPA: SDR family NAD(P)-dependent oxidoreductase, partial [Candidatus Competibacteraceae bacterium]|nr:SDR family NAD(P)-dependent oxidoreductase [Candidatus Competibacteraceae bacterium]